MQTQLKQEPPTEEDIIAFAEWLEIAEYPTLYWIAKEGLTAPLPTNWKLCATEEGDVYYFNFETGESSWDHPMDAHYKQVAQEEKRKYLEKQKEVARKTQKEDLRKKQEVHNNTEKNGASKSLLNPIQESGSSAKIKRKQALDLHEGDENELNELSYPKQSNVLEKTRNEESDSVSYSANKSHIPKDSLLLSALSISDLEESNIEATSRSINGPSDRKILAEDAIIVNKNIEDQDEMINIEDIIDIESYSQDLPISEEDVQQASFNNHSNEEKRLMIEERTKLMNRREEASTDDDTTSDVMYVNSKKSVDIDEHDTPLANRSSSPQNISKSTKKKSSKKRTLNPLKISTEANIGNTSSLELGIPQKNILGGGSPKDNNRKNESPLSNNSDTATQDTTTPSPALFSHTEVLLQNQKLIQQENVLKKSVQHLRKKEKQLLQSINTLSKSEKALKMDQIESKKRYRSSQKEISENTQLLRRQKEEIELVLEEMHHQEMEARKSLESVESEYTMLNKQIALYKKELKDRGELEKENSQLKNQISSLRQEISSLEHEVEGMRSTKLELKNDIESLKVKKIELNQSIDHLHDAFQSSKAIKETEAEQEIAKSIQKLIQQKEELSTSLNLMMHKQSELTQETLKRREENRRIMEDTSTLKQTKLDLETSILQLKGEETALKESIKEFNRQKKELPIHLEQLRREYDRLLSKIPILKADYESTSKDLEYSTSELENLRSDVKQMKREKLVLEQEVDNLTHKKNTLSKRIEALSTQTERENYDSEKRQALLDSIETLQFRKSTLEKAITRIQQSLNDMEAQVRNLRNREQKMQKNYDRLLDQYSSLKKKQKLYEEDINRMREEKSSLRKKSEMLEEQIQKLGKKLEEKQKSLKEEVHSLEQWKESDRQSTEQVKNDMNIAKPISSQPEEFSNFSNVDVSKINILSKEAWAEGEDRTPLSQIVTPTTSTKVSTYNWQLEFEKLDQLQDYCQKEKIALRRKKAKLEKAKTDWRKDKDSGSVRPEVLQKVKNLLETQTQNMNRDIEQLNHLQHYIILRKEELQLLQTTESMIQIDSPIHSPSNMKHSSPNIKSKLSKIEQDIERILAAMSLPIENENNAGVNRQQYNENLNIPFNQRGKAYLNPTINTLPLKGQELGNAHVSQWNQYFKNYMVSDDMSINGRLWGFQEIIRDWQDKRGKERQLLDSHESWLNRFRKALEFNV